MNDVNTSNPAIRKELLSTICLAYGFLICYSEIERTKYEIEQLGNNKTKMDKTPRPFDEGNMPITFWKGDNVLLGTS